jgi:hypothetical protein
MKPGAIVALVIALGSLAGSVALGLWNRSTAGPGVALNLDREAYMTGGYRAGDLRSVTLHQDTRRGWLDQAKLSELGFRRRHHGSPLPRPAYLVLERDTLLTVIDAGRNAAALHMRYDNPNRYLVLRGLIGAYYYMNEGRADGQVRGLLPPRLYLPSGVGREGPIRLHSGRLHYPFVTE